MEKQSQNKIRNLIISFLLIFNGTAAIYGGLNLMLYPDGSSISLSMVWLQHTPFNDYFIPGAILFVANGVFSVIALIAMFLRHRSYSLLVIAQGAILIGWLLIQMLLIMTINGLHMIMAAVGLLLLILGTSVRESRMVSGHAF